MATQLSLTGTPVTTAKATRKSYSREYKLQVVDYYRDPQYSLYVTSKHFDISTKCILRWAKGENKIKKSTKGSKHISHSRAGAHQEMEEILHQEFLELRRKGLKVKAYWFRVRGQQILAETNPEANFSFSSGWFDRFKARQGISLRRTTNIAQKPANDKEDAIRRFHLTIRNEAKLSVDDVQSDVGKYSLRQVANMDQTPLPFSFAGDDTYSEKGAKTVWVRGGASGMEKRQCTVQLTIFADGVPRVKPLLIFCGKGKRITFREKV